MAEKFRRTWQPAPQSRITRILNQVAVLTDFMHGDGSEAFAMLSDKTKDELRALFNVLNTDLRHAISR
ncbi:hypothetical protein DP44_570 [Burkholderia pseudomallei]|uniref:hypothetical protein n=1 Tax=Burkholderia pseudomallei TaxID=28450 RepID=UPI00050FA422|nr:hypothetical protein [Burkholderia pseudomallei]KGD35278.1 hypothetical protein DP44_570 [Burkholderia pseudomallei]KGV07969.1 hypothetical protein X895_2160 [Burkholderia pseudomallei MSHR4503]